jgi:hypothetical protein
MIPLAIVALITEALKLVNNLIEGVPVAQRQADARAWFLFWWPKTKWILKLGGEVSDADLAEIEKMAGKKEDLPK